MKEYMLGIFVISLVFGVLECLTYKPRGGMGERLALALLLAYAVLSPLEGLSLSAGGRFPIQTPDFSDESAAYEQTSQIAFEEGIARAVSEEFSIKEEYVKVSAEGFLFKEMKAERIRVTLSVKALAADPKRVEAYINSYGIGECEVCYEIG